MYDIDCQTLIIIPAFNAATTITGVISGLQYQNILVVDDGSEDNTSKIVKQIGVKLIRHRKNLGLGKAIKTGIDFAIKKEFTHVVILDSDGQHPPQFLKKFLNKIHLYDLLIGNRFHNLMKLPHQKIASNFLGYLLTNELLGADIKDISCGFRGFKINKNLLTYKSNGYDFIYEQNFRAIETKAKIGYISIPAIYKFNNLLCTKVEELEGFFSSLFDYLSYRNMVIQDELLLLAKQIGNKSDFFFNFKSYSFYGFYISNVDSYIIQTDFTKAIDYFLNISRRSKQE